MSNSFGKFLKQRRQEKKLTQKELAKLLIVSESAVSKWEKDVAHPDITLLPKLSEILGVTEHELITASIDKNSRIEKVQAKKWRTFSMSWSLFFYISYGITIITCFICNLATSGSLSWFWIVLSALLLAFTFTNLPKLIKKHRIIILPLAAYSALCILLEVCCIYTNGNWFWITILSILLGLIIILVPICISIYKVFTKIKKYNDFISISIDFVALNILLMAIDTYCFTNHYSTVHWFFNLALPITILVYLILNILLCVRFFKINRFLKTSIILFTIDIIMYIPPLFVHTQNSKTQDEIDSLNVFKTDFSNWKIDVSLERNIHCIIALTILTLSIIFLIIGLIKFNRENTQKTQKKKK